MQNSEIIVKTKKTNFTSIFSIGFLFAFSLAITAYINSTFLATFISEDKVGLFYSTASLLTIILLIWIPVILRKIGNYKASILFILINIIMLSLIILIKDPIIVIIAFILHITSTTITLFNIDVFLETFSKDETTGNTRGLFLSILNLAWLVSPAIAGFILTNGDYWKIYLTSLILTLPILFILSLNFQNFKDSRYERTKFWETLKILYRRKNVFRIFISQFVLRFFYSWMVIYAPIYLHKHIGFDWSTLGIIFTVMLLPFVLLEFPLGKLADKSLGEKEILNTGFVIIALSVATISFITSTNPIIWAIILFITRVGASMVEISSESYFFKKIDSDDTNILSLFRMARPIAYLIGPAVATTVLSFTDIKNLFIILGFIVLILGLSFGLRIKDTK